MLDAEQAEPATAERLLGVGGTHIEPYGVLESAGYDVEGGQVAHVGTVHLGRDIANALLDLPDALTAGDR